LVAEKDEPNVVEIKTANINFEVEEMDEREIKPDLGLPDVFPDAPPEMSHFDISKLNRTMTMNSQRHG